MSRKKTALQVAQDRGRAGINPQRLLITLGIGLCLAMSAVCVIQALGVGREQRSTESLRAAQASLADTLTRLVRDKQNALTTALDDNELRAALTVVDDVSRQRATTLLRERLPETERVEFYDPRLPELVESDLGKFGYSRANILAEARSNGGIARAQMHRLDDKMLFAQAQAVRDGERVVAYAYVLTPGQAVLDAVQQQSIASGRLSLRQGGGAATLTQLASGGATVGDEIVVEVPESIFAIATQRVDAFKLGEWVPLVDIDNTFALWVVGVLLLLLAGLLVVIGRAMTGAPVAGKAEGIGGVLDNLAGKLRDRAKKPEPDEQVMPVTAAKPKPAADAARVAAKPVVEKPASDARGVAVDRSIFRAYDIRGVVGKTLSKDVARMLGLAIGSVIRERGLSEVVVGRDGRLSGPELAQELIRGLRATGCDVIDIGAVPTPMVYFATYHLNAGSGVAVTGSHNPPDYNGFKIVVGGETLAEDAITDLYTRIVEGRFSLGNGGLQTMDVTSDYIERITGDVQVERKLKVVVDCGNGIPGAIAPQVLEGVGCEVIPLYCDVDGTFPNHHPDPSDPHNLEDLIVSVKRLKADIGLAFDGDGDRLGVVTANGEIIYPDRLLMMFAIDVLNRNPGAAIIYDVKCTGHLQDLILRHGGSPMMWKTGHSLIKAKMREEDAELAGEMSGHFFFRERWYGFDDGVYAAARLVEILGATDRAPQELFDELPKGVSTPELKINMEEGAHQAFMGRFRERASFPGSRVSNIDGVRADYPDGWGLVRCSNTTPSLVLRFDADNEQALRRIQETFREQLLALGPDLKLPF